MGKGFPQYPPKIKRPRIILWFHSNWEQQKHGCLAILVVVYK